LAAHLKARERHGRRDVEVNRGGHRGEHGNREGSMRGEETPKRRGYVPRTWAALKSTSSHTFRWTRLSWASMRLKRHLSGGDCVLHIQATPKVHLELDLRDCLQQRLATYQIQVTHDATQSASHNAKLCYRQSREVGTSAGRLHQVPVYQRERGQDGASVRSIFNNTNSMTLIREAPPAVPFGQPRVGLRAALRQP
jgi:hypothetical protein